MRLGFDRGRDFVHHRVERLHVPEPATGAPSRRPMQGARTTRTSARDTPAIWRAITRPGHGAGRSGAADAHGDRRRRGSSLTTSKCEGGDFVDFGERHLISKASTARCAEPCGSADMLDEQRTGAAGR